MGWDLATDTDPLDDGAVPVDVRLGQVLQQPTTLTDEDQQAATAVVVVKVRTALAADSPTRVCLLQQLPAPVR